MVRIAIFSDIHCGYFSRTETFSVPGQTRQEESISGSSWESGLIELLKEKQPSYIFVAGDLTSVGSPQEFFHCEKEIIKIANDIGLSPDKIVCCTGNHDIDYGIVNLWKQEETLTPETESFRKERYQLIASSISKYCLDTISEVEEKNRGPAPFSGIYESDEFVVFVLNTGWYCGPNQEYAHGMLSCEQLEWFEQTVTRYSTDIRKKVVLMHHHPFKYSFPVVGEDTTNIAEGSEFVDIAVKHGIDLVIHGHRHHPKVETEIINVGNNPITFLCAGSLAVNAKHRANGEIPNTVHFIDIDKNLDYFVLHNYSYTDSKKWHIMTDDPATPMDGVMKIGKVFDKGECIKKIEEYEDKDSVELEWSELAECLQFMKYNEVKELLKTQLTNHRVIGSFPDTVILKRKC